MMMASPTQTAVKSSTLDGLPKSFVQVLRTLFDILDDKRTGLVKFTDIEARWQEDNTSDLPKGVIESLRKVTPANGLLSFERFCAGLKICLLRNQMESRNKSTPENTLTLPPKHLSQRPPSAPILDVFESNCPPVTNDNQWNKCPLPINQFSNPSRQNQLRTLSMPQLPSDAVSKESESKDAIIFRKQHSSNGLLLGPPKPPRSNVAVGYFNQRPENNKAGKTEIRAALQNWRLGLMSEDKQAAAYRAMSNIRSIGDGKGVQDYPESEIHKKQNTGNRRREPRRHTLQNGIDCNMLKKIRQIESEKEVLLEGLQAVERASEWYRKQLTIIQDKMKYVCRTGSQEQWSEAQQERIELLRARVLEVNRHLATLGGSSGNNNKSKTIGDGLPLHMNLAVQSQSRVPHVQVMNQLKRQNHVLTRENTHKDEKIKNLEREKAALLRELFQTGRKSEPLSIRKSQNGNENLPVATPAYI